MRNEGSFEGDAGEEDDLNTAFGYEPFHFVSYLIFFITSALILFLNFFADSEPQQMKYVAGDKPCPELCASFPSKIFFQWFDTFVWKGFRRPLENDDLWHMNPEDTSNEGVK